ncbi:MAG: hypothetical protein ACRDSE_20405 [Pseudonocardiaceae bacterium]
MGRLHMHHAALVREHRWRCAALLTEGRLVACQMTALEIIDPIDRLGS